MCVYTYPYMYILMRVGIPEPIAGLLKHLCSNSYADCTFPGARAHPSTHHPGRLQALAKPKQLFLVRMYAVSTRDMGAWTPHSKTQG